MTQRLRRSRRHCGFTLVEVVAATLIVGVMLVGAMNLLGAVIRGRQSTSDDDRAALLAEELLIEILENAYEEPDEAPLFGIESGETTGDRTTLDDVDDFDGLTNQPPADRLGNVMTFLSDWRRDVSVKFADPNSPSTSVGTDQGAKRITISVFRGGNLIYTLTGLRTRLWKNQ